MKPFCVGLTVLFLCLFNKYQGAEVGRAAYRLEQVFEIELVSQSPLDECHASSVMRRLCHDQQERTG